MPLKAHISQSLMSRRKDRRFNMQILGSALLDAVTYLTPTSLPEMTSPSSCSKDCMVPKHALGVSLQNVRMLKYLDVPLVTSSCPKNFVREGWHF